MAGPTKLKIGNHVYAVSYPRDQPEGLEGLYGRTNVLKTKIEINPHVAMSQQRDTLLHEVLHAVIDDAHINLADDTEEMVIRAITPGLLGVLRANPALVTYLLSKEA